jgi:hypothetical protein
MTKTLVHGKSRAVLIAEIFGVWLPSLHNGIYGLPFLSAQLTIACFNAACNLENSKENRSQNISGYNMSSRRILQDRNNDYTTIQVSEQTCPSAIISKTWYWPPLLSTIPIAVSMIGANEVGPVKHYSSHMSQMNLTMLSYVKLKTSGWCTNQPN